MRATAVASLACASAVAPAAADWLLVAAAVTCHAPDQTNKLPDSPTVIGGGDDGSGGCCSGSGGDCVTAADNYQWTKTIAMTTIFSC